MRLWEKQQEGADFAITQRFYDADSYNEFMLVSCRPPHFVENGRGRDIGNECVRQAIRAHGKPAG